MYYFGGGVDNEGGFACVGAGCIWEIYVFSAQFCYESRTLLEGEFY